MKVVAGSRDLRFVPRIEGVSLLRRGTLRRVARRRRYQHRFDQCEKAAQRAAFPSQAGAN